ncbi:MAG: GntR family transcriptional regulator [Actinomycetes bacterium]
MTGTGDRGAVVELDAGSPVPPYEQLRAQLEAAIVSGGLAAEERLPTVRQLAGDLGVAPGTVQRAYRELEGLGLVEGRGRRGTVVTPPATWRSDLDPEEEGRRAAERFVAETARLGLPPARAVELVRSALAGATAGDG